MVTHKANEYVRGDITTNTVESSFALLKRGLIGTFHHVGQQHLQRYAKEFDFPWNHRRVTDTERAAALPTKIGGSA
ncbi:MAG TPA: transposase [Nevskia sp.]|nr:transposase [Nevskia sp.]